MALPEIIMKSMKSEKVMSKQQIGPAEYNPTGNWPTYELSDGESQNRDTYPSLLFSFL